mgnify:CR=1 FL=1
MKKTYFTLGLLFYIFLQNTQASICSVSSEQPAIGKSFMVAAAHPSASKAGCEILKNGGTAIDAAIAVQAVLSVVEPESSGLAGGSLITYWDEQSKRVHFYEGLSRAPKHVTQGLRTPTKEDKLQHKVDSYTNAVEVTGRAFGVPGTLKVLDLVHKSHGKKDWSTLFEKSISLAKNGFPMPLYMNTVLGEKTRGLKRCKYPDLRNRYCNGDIPKPVGEIIFNSELAQVLKEVRDGGANALYDPKGTIAPAIIERIKRGKFKPKHDKAGTANIPSLMTVEDFAAYEARERKAICAVVFGHKICGSAPPAYGGTAVLAILKLMEIGGIENMKPGSAEYIHLAIESSRLAQWDRREYIGDPDYNDVPVYGLLDDDYLKQRFSLFSPNKAINPLTFGNPPRGKVIKPLAISAINLNNKQKFTREDDDMTSHISIVDSYGNALSMTTTNNTTFGSQLEARGITLNNVQTNFTRLDSKYPGNPVNIMESMKKARTSTSPTIVFDSKGRVKLVVGAAGGGAIPDYIAQTILGVLLHGLDPQAAINQDHFSGQGPTSKCAGFPGARSELEKGTKVAEHENALKKLGHPCFRLKNLRSGLSAIEVRDGALWGASDSRRDGIAIGH